MAVASAPSHKVFDAVAVSSTNTVYGGSTSIGGQTVPGNPVGSDINGSISVCYIGKFTGTPNGTLSIEVSNASDKDVFLGNDLWITEDSFAGSGFTAGVATVTSGAINGSANFFIRGICRARRMRLKYVNASGSGTISATLTVKEN